MTQADKERDHRLIRDAFQIYFEKERTWEQELWLGVPMWKNPFDALILQELIFKTRPDFLIETGTGLGGSALFFATIMEIIDHGRVLTVDSERKAGALYDCILKPRHRISCFVGDSKDNLILRQMGELCAGARNMVILDSWHTKKHVLAELDLYSPLVAKGCYLVVEDTHVNGHPTPWKWGEGPYEAVEEFLGKNKNFWRDKNCEKLKITNNPGGFLKRIE